MSTTTAHPTTTQSPAPQVGQYKGHPLLILNPDSRHPFQFGLAKARLILEHADAIRRFVEQHDQMEGGAA